MRSMKGARPSLPRHIRPPLRFFMLCSCSLCKWHPKAKIKSLMNPDLAQVQKLVLSLRKSAKSDRVLLHYNGHSVLRPTPTGDLWLFSKGYSEVSAGERRAHRRLLPLETATSSASAVRAPASADPAGVAAGGSLDPGL